MRFPALCATTAAVAMIATAAPAGAHERDLMTAGGQVGPIKTNRSTIRDMKQIFGEPTRRKVVRVGCSRVVRLRWRDQMQTYTYRGDEERRIVDVKILARTVRVAETSFRFHTRKGLRVGDTEARLRDLYPHRRGEVHHGHTHYILRSSRYGMRLLAKVVDGEIVQLEAAPYEFC